jgi:hypothetical protein
MGEVVQFVAAAVGLVACDECGARWEDMDAATHQDGYSEKGCPNGCHRLTTPVYWPDDDAPGGWSRG